MCVEELYRRFRKPMDEDPALSAAPEYVRDRVSRLLWVALVTGPEIQDSVWDVLTECGLETPHLELVRRCFRERMRPTISEDDLQDVRLALSDGD